MRQSLHVLAEALCGTKSRNTRRDPHGITLKRSLKSNLGPRGRTNAPVDQVPSLARAIRLEDSRVTGNTEPHAMTSDYVAPSCSDSLHIVAGMINCVHNNAYMTWQCSIFQDLSLFGWVCRQG
jgi:hypothetical protein